MHSISSFNSPAELAARFINQTSRHVFLTGKAGTGKTTFLHQIIQHTHKRAVIVAPTGIAAINAGGVTIHSQFNLPFGCFVPENGTSESLRNIAIYTPATLFQGRKVHASKLRVIRELELLIIDEVSMLRADVLDTIDLVLRSVRRNQDSFGGVQVLFIGDMFQLPPVVKEEEWRVLHNYYKSIFFFDARVLQKEPPVYIELDKVFRQKEEGFIALLNNLRNDQVTAADIELLNKHYHKDFKPSLEEKYIVLTTHNYKATAINRSYLDQLPGASFFFEGQVENEFSESAYPVEKRLELKEGAQLMFVKNDPTGAQRFFNGKIVTVASLSPDEIVVSFGNEGPLMKLEKYEWTNIRYEINESTKEIEEKIIGKYFQYPVRLAWAITVHKSQGLSFDKAILDVEAAFAPGQVYVALSRLRSLNGLVLTSPLNFSGLGQDKEVVTFSSTKDTQADPLQMVQQDTLVFLENQLLQAFDLNLLYYEWSRHVNSYDKEKGRSTKQKHVAWAKQQKQEVTDLKMHADRFSLQIKQILASKEQDYLLHLEDRLTKAVDYFVAAFNKFRKSIAEQLLLLEEKKKVKEYVDELLELEDLLVAKIYVTHKAKQLCVAVRSTKELTKSTFSLPSIPVYIRQSNDTFSEEQAKRPENKRKKKASKPDTKNISYELLLEGKDIGSIAAMRSLTRGTVEAHLLHFVKSGKLGLNLLVAQEKAERIKKVAETMKEPLLNSIKEALGEEYSYGDIKFVLAAMQNDKT